MARDKNTKGHRGRGVDVRRERREERRDREREGGIDWREGERKGGIEEGKESGRTEGWRKRGRDRRREREGWRMDKWRDGQLVTQTFKAQSGQYQASLCSCTELCTCGMDGKAE